MHRRSAYLFRKMVTFVKFRDITIRIDRPEEISHRDRDICNRAYELLKGDWEEDDWTQEMDRLFSVYNIKYELAKEEEFKEFVKKANEFSFRM